MTHRDLEVYKLSISLVSEIYKITRNYPSFERFNLSSQMQRAAVSVPSNIAEGASRRGSKEYIYFLYISTGSLSELETQLEVSRNLAYIESQKVYSDLHRLINDIRIKLLTMIKHLECKQNNQS